jgi:DNA repair ATPase RecN
MVRNILERMGVDPSPMLGTGQAGVPVTLKLKRSLLLSDSSGRIKSACSINDQSVTLKILKSVGAPLLAIVNAPAAASALGRPGSRMAMLDTAVPSVVLTWVRQLQANYLKCRKAREKLEHELATRTLPISMNINGDDEKDLKLLRHWIDELDGFEGRISKVCQSIPSEGLDGGSSLAILMEEFDGLAWMDNDSDGMAFSSALYRRLFDLSDHLKLMDDKIEAALKARESLASLSMPDSARTALERTRDLLVDATAGEDWSPSAEEMNDSKLVTASERAHQLLNHVEDALTECANFLDDDEKGLVGILQSERNACKLSSEDIMAYTTEWSTLARKHGISPYLLPSCHASLRQELDGNVEARTLLPAAKKAETKALTSLEEGCQVLSQARSELAKRLSRSISRRLPLLGMENSRFETRLRTIGDPTYISGLGVDEVDFFLLHDTSKSTTTNSAQDDSFVGSNNNGESQSSSSQRGGKVDLVASSGEKARILLAIECEIPGSVRALCGITPGGSDGDDENTTPPPVAVIYDEIDAHVGGRASVSVAQMLSDQSRSCQVVSITHSPSVAAMADLHICIQRHAPSADGRIVASANLVEGSSRRKELARMAAGDMAPEEAEVFVEALIRDVRLKPEEWK